MSYKILIVDDSKLARMAVNKALNALYPDWSRIEAANSDEALVAIRDKTVDVALLDYNMPGRDGVELAAEFRRINPRMAVAVISANRQHEVVERTRATGADFLPKPITEQALGEFLDAALQQMHKDES